MKMCVERSELILENQVQGESLTVDISDQFDGLWDSCVWTANRGIISTIADFTAQVLEMSYKYCICPQCTEMKEKKNGKM